MGRTPPRRSMLAAATLVLVASAVATPAQAGPTAPSRMPAAASHGSPHSPTTVVALQGAATTVAGAARATSRATSRGTWTTPVRRFTRSLPVDPAATEVTRLVNVARAAAGCAAVRPDARLATAARLHSEDMARQGYFSHTSLDGRTPWDRMRAQGYPSGSGENIAAGYGTPAAVMRAWMDSPGHRANILSCSSVALGVGIGRGGSYGTYWTQDFGRS